MNAGIVVENQKSVMKKEFLLFLLLALFLWETAYNTGSFGTI